ncbi:MAG: polysaccharide deacetylase family protein [Chitinophagales bacterium]
MRAYLFQIAQRAGLLNTVFYLQKHRLYVLYFHRVSIEYSPAYPPLNPDVFSGIMDFVNDRFKIIDFSELEHNFKSKKPLAIITFDDGFSDFAEYAFPVLEHLNIPVTMNVITDCAETGLPNWTQKINCLVEAFAIKNLQPELMGLKLPKLESGRNEGQIALDIFRHLSTFKLAEIQDQIDVWERQLKGDYKYTPMLKWDEIKKLTDTGLVIPGSHTKTHINLSQNHSDEILKSEIIETKKTIENKLNCKVDRFAFPNGLYNKRSLQTVIDAGYEYIQLTGEKAIENLPEDKPYIVNRIEPFYASISENLFKIAGFHSMIAR